MNKIKRFLSIILSAVFAFALFACAPKNPDDGKNPDGSDPSGDNATEKVTQTLPEEQTHRITTGLHKISVTDSDREFVKNGNCEYKIVINDTQMAKTAADFLSARIKEATGAELETVDQSEVAYSADAKLIVIGCDGLFAAAGLTMPSDELGATGYYLKTAGDSAFIATKEVHGYQQGVLGFLRNVLGYEAYATDTVVYHKSGATLPNMEIIEKPDFEFHRTGNGLAESECYMLGYNMSANMYVKAGGEYWHNVTLVLPKSVYGGAHPDWYSNRGDQLCATARGHNEGAGNEYDALVDTAATELKRYLDEMPDNKRITFTIMDNMSYCNCPACTAENTKYGCASASYIKLNNAIAKAIDAKYAAQNRERDFILMMFAYQGLETAPAEIKDGKWTAMDDSVKLYEKCGVYIAPIGLDYTVSIYDEVNKNTYDMINAWAALTDKIDFWLYESNFDNWTMPYNSFEAVLEYYRFCKSVNGRAVNNLGQYLSMPNPTGFTRLKEYIDSKGQFDVNVDYETLVADFFENYFREGAQPMRKFFDELVTYMFWLKQTYSTDCNGSVHEYNVKEQYWGKELLNHYLSYIDEAYKAVAVHEESDPELYAKLVRHIKAESIFPRYLLCVLYSGTYSNETALAMKMEFRDDIRTLNNTYVYEWSSLYGNKWYTFEDLFRSWGVA